VKHILSVKTLNFQGRSAILSAQLKKAPMAKKSKKKTVASTRPQIKVAKTDPKPDKKKKILGKLFAKRIPRKKAEPKGALRMVQSLIKDQLHKVEETAEQKEEEIEVKPPEKKEPEKEKKEPEKKEKIRKRLSPEHRQKIRGGLLALIGLFALTFIGWFLFGKMFRPQYLAEILPAESTVGVLEINVDSGSGQVKQFYDLMKNYAVYQHDGLVNFLTLALPLDFAKEIEPWLGRRAGIAFVSTAKKGELARIYFIESRDRNLTEEFLKSKAMQDAKEELTVTDYNNYKLYGYSLSHLFEATFIGNYLVIAENEITLKELLDKINAGGERLNDEAVYRKTANNLPQGSLTGGYLNLQKLYDVLSADENFVAKKGQDFLAFKPYLSLFDAVGFTCFADKDKFVIQTFVALNKDALTDDKFISYSEKYRGALLSLAPEDPVGLAAGHDLTKEIGRLEEVFAGSTKSNSQVFNGLLEAQKNIYLGKAISLSGDIYPLLGGEYLFAVENNLENPAYTLILELMNKNQDIQRLEKIMSALEKTGGFFTSKIQEVVLPDGTKGQEIVASPELIERFEENHEGTVISDLKMGETGWHIYYAVSDDKAIITTNKDIMKNILDRIAGKVSSSFVSTGFYKRIVGRIIGTADEIFTVKTGAVTEWLGLNENEMLKPYLLPFSGLTAAKNYFTDGISTIYSLEII
jgi:hypothetical protein